ncbi:DNA-processing protein DprA [Pigmentiphaga litoralis]|uniref:DNA-processing protein DprA n=1 Tax=Pigmentiphaga litoralis TaxID=516702 RepID=UPI003B42930C
MPSASVSDSLAAWLRLSFEPNVGPVTAYHLLQEFGLPDQLYAHDLDALAAKLPIPLARQLAAPADDATRRRIDDALAWADQPGHYLMTLNDRHYPPALLVTHDPPTLLYVKGLPSLLGRHGLAIVGSRNATPDGVGHAREFARHLARLGYTIVSGLALGIDAAAHEGALAAGADGGGTLAVVGTGADVVYPRSNHALAQRIADQGAIVSELPLGTRGLAHHFPRRNRLVAGLSKGVLVVEAATHSGSLITARIAADIGRDVFAIPGSIHSPLSRGCHLLLRQGAKLVECSQDIVDELTNASGAAQAPLPSGAPAGAMATTQGDGHGRQGDQASHRPNGAGGRPGTPAAPALPSLSPEDLALLRAMGFGPVTPDMLAYRLGAPIQEVLARLLPLELRDRVHRLAGGRFQLAGPIAKALAAQLAREAQAAGPEGKDSGQDAVHA